LKFAGLAILARSSSLPTSQATATLAFPVRYRALGRSLLNPISLSLCLVDANIPPQPSDTHMIDYLRQTNRPVLVVATKADRIGTRIQASVNALKKAHGVDFVLPYSSKSGLGQDELWKRLRIASESGTAENA